MSSPHVVVAAYVPGSACLTECANPVERLAPELLQHALSILAWPVLVRPAAQTIALP